MPTPVLRSLLPGRPLPSRCCCRLEVGQMPTPVDHVLVRHLKSPLQDVGFFGRPLHQGEGDLPRSLCSHVLAVAESQLEKRLVQGILLGGVISWTLAQNGLLPHWML